MSVLHRPLADVPSLPHRPVTCFRWPACASSHSAACLTPFAHLFASFLPRWPGARVANISPCFPSMASPITPDTCPSPSSSYPASDVFRPPRDLRIVQEIPTVLAFASPFVPLSVAYLLDRQVGALALWMGSDPCGVLIGRAAAWRRTRGHFTARTGPALQVRWYP